LIFFLLLCNFFFSSLTCDGQCAFIMT
jgi:hypothetical protein